MTREATDAALLKENILESSERSISLQIRARLNEDAKFSFFKMGVTKIFTSATSATRHG